MPNDIPSAFTLAAKSAASGLVPYAALKDVLEAAGKVTYEEQLGYSIVHVTKDGKPATDLKSAAFVSMPHVLARGNDKAVAGAMKQAGFTKDGLCKGRNSIEERQKEAARLGTKLWSMFGAAPAPKAKAAPKVKAPEVAPVEATTEA